MEHLRARFAEGKSICVGLDLDFELFPEFLQRRKAATDIRLYDFAERIIHLTADLVCAYKPNIAFYEAHGQAGMSALANIIRLIHEVAPGIPVILDAKRGDIDSTNLGYVHSAFEYLGADAITVSPYLGQEALAPFLEREDKGIIVLCRTSNKGAGEFQDSQVLIDDPVEHAFFEQSCGMLNVCGYMQAVVSVYQRVAYRVARHWNARGNCMLVVGATYPEELGYVRRIVGEMPLLIPGIGAQGGDVEATVKNGRDQNGHGMIINSSRGIIYAADPRAEAQKLDGRIRQFATA
jgi:orotidine-5'-phosphate decarboxylase